MPENKRVSVIMAVYNEEDFLAQALESVLGQTFTDVEIIVSDDGSTDATPTIAEAYAARHPNRVRLLRAERNQGKPFALNRALKAHRGELIAWLDGDDVMLPTKLERQVATLDSHPSAAGCTHDAEIFDSASGTSLGRFSRTVNGGPMRSGDVALLFDPTYKMLPSATMVRSKLCPPAGFDERLAFTNDWLFDIELFRHGRCVALDEVLVRYRRHGDNFTSRAESSGVSVREGLMTMAIVSSRFPDLKRRARQAKTAILLGQARRAAARGDWRAAWRFGADAHGAGGIRGVLDVTTSLIAARMRSHGGR